jgi:hypothetical protein
MGYRYGYDNIATDKSIVLYQEMAIAPIGKLPASFWIKNPKM